MKFIFFIMKLFVFGSTGDLVKRKVLPALQSLGRENLEIYALGRKDIRNKDYLEQVCDGDRCTPVFMDKIKYQKIDFEKEDICEGSCLDLFNKDETNYLYVSLPPHLIEKVLKSVVKLRGIGFDMKVLIEKPFGDNSTTARNLKKIIEENDLVDDIFLSDHYLFKEFVEFGDFEKMKIVSNESVGLEGRVGYYDSVGAVKDMIQSHFMNIVFKYVSDHENEFGDFEVLDFKRGQYRGYTGELGKNSDTETFVNLKFKTKNKVFEFVTGKGLDKKEFYIEVDGRRFDIESSGDYERLFRDFFDHSKFNFADIERSVFSWVFVEKLEENLPDLFYYDKGVGLRN